MTPDDVTRLFAAHHAPLFRYLARLTGDPDRAADAAQEAFVRMMERPPVFAPDAAGDAARAWLFTVATNVVREGGRTGSPVTLRRIGGRSAGVDVAAGPGTGAAFAGGRSLTENPAKGVVVSVPSACRRAFSCRPCTSRKCAKSSGHLMSSRPSLDRVEERFVIVLGMRSVEWRMGPGRGGAYSRFRCDVEKP